MTRLKTKILILIACSLAVGFVRSAGQNSPTGPSAGKIGKKVAHTQPASQPASQPTAEQDKSVLMNMTFDDLPEGNVQTRRLDIRKQTGHRLHLYDNKADYDITSDHPAQPWAKEKKGKALRISKLSRSRHNTGYLFFEGYLERYVIVEFDVYLPDIKAPFWIELTYHRPLNRGPRAWVIYKPASSNKFSFLPYLPGAKASWFPAVIGQWTRYRIETDTEKRTVSLWIGRPEGKMRLLKKNAKFETPMPVFVNVIKIRLDSGYSNKNVYIDNIKVYERAEGTNNESKG